ncbi:DUF423 domain-containing protein [Aneurinibacillus terranovensis]|uniref:DUF423 domain-containing protein n=1 Tax=Aneurinibacillus terranovensis TaxID=278991 RepID=UPI00040EA331|nr:DUF423 domain-containing protein [Aneurinibacillus terranovensis]
MIRLFLFLGSINMFLSVALGAFGAHQLKGRLSPGMLEIYQTGVHYQMIHGLAILFIALVGEKLSGTLPTWSGWLMQIGIILFSGSLYALSTSGIRVLGAITPIGGVAFLAGWALLAIAAFKG